MMKNYHKRNNYERLLVILCHYCNEKIPKLNSISDYWLLLQINEKLARLGLITYTEQELENIDIT